MQVNNRLFEIVYILMQKKKVTAKELADRFEVSTRTIYRDIETLSRANIPIYSNKGKDGGIGLLEEHFERELPQEEKEEKNNFEIISLELEISKKIAYRVYDEFESKEITKKDDGNFIVKVEYPENEWVYGYILSFGEYVKVLSPDRAKNIIKSKLEITLKNYL